MEYPNVKHHNINHVEVSESSCTNRHHMSWVCGVIRQLSFGISHEMEIDMEIYKSVE